MTESEAGRLAPLRQLMTQALLIEERMLAVVGVVKQAAGDPGLRPILSGGLAMWVWTGTSEFATADVDLVMTHSEEFARRLESLGFERQGKFFVRKDAELFLEFPGSELPEGWATTDVQAANDLVVPVVSPEDILIDRLNAAVHWSELDMAKQAVVMILSSEALDETRLRDRAQEEGLADALKTLTEVADRMRDGAKIADDELTELVRHLGPGTI